MRFVRVYIEKATGKPLSVIEQEHPIGAAEVEHVGTVTECIDLGLVNDFDPVALDGTPCNHASHIRQRIEKHPLADTHPDAPKVRFAPEHKDVPRIHFCPCDTKGIEAHIKANGHDRLSSTAHAWLAHILPPHEVKRLGIGGKTSLAHMKALEKARRGQVDGGQVFNIEREIHQRSEVAREKRVRNSAKDMKPIEAADGKALVHPSHPK